MIYRNFGSTGEEVSALGLGCMGMSSVYGPRNDDRSLSVLHRALELGINFWDTADMYGHGHNEELLGEVLKTHREEVFLATKFGFRYRSEEGYDTYFDGRPEYVKQACEASLKRLGVDVIDLYYAHRVDPDVPIEETVGAMAELVDEGKVRHLGLSEASAASLRKAAAVHPIAALQTEYSLFTRGVEEEILPACRALNVAFVPYSPLGRGMLTGALEEASTSYDASDFRRTLPRFQENNFARNLQLVRQLEALAEEKGCTPAQLALSWLLHQGEDVFPIPGTKRISYLEENAKAVDITLSVEERKQISDALPAGAAAGERHTPGGLELVNN